MHFRLEDIQYQRQAVQSVLETKGTDSLDDAGALTGSEVFKIRCAQKHFAALGIRTQIDYEAPVQHYSTFKQRAGGKMHE